MAQDQLQALHDLIGLAVLDARVEVLLALADHHNVHADLLGHNERGVGRAGSHVGANSPSDLRMVTFRLLKPPSCGVLIGPL